MKYKYLIAIVLAILLIDQASKIYIKTHFFIGDSVHVFGDWFQLYFIENEGMAFGMKIMDNEWGKLILTLFRLVAVIFGFFWLHKLSKQQYKKGLLVCGALILAGAAGNLIDSMFYGLLFTPTQFSNEVSSIVKAGEAGYGRFLHGRVVDMLHFPLIDTTWPNWVPYFGGKRLSFFDPIFNIADAAISTGIITLLLFQNRWLPKKEETDLATNNTQSTNENLSEMKNESHNNI